MTHHCFLAVLSDQQGRELKMPGNRMYDFIKMIARR